MVRQSRDVVQSGAEILAGRRRRRYRKRGRLRCCEQGRPRSLRTQLPWLQPHRSFYFLLPGHPSRLLEAAETAAAAGDAARRMGRVSVPDGSIARWHVVGHDAGSIIAAHYAHSFQERVVRLALLSPALFPDLKPYFLLKERPVRSSIISTSRFLDSRALGNLCGFCVGENLRQCSPIFRRSCLRYQFPPARRAHELIPSCEIGLVRRNRGSLRVLATSQVSDRALVQERGRFESHRIFSW